MADNRRARVSIATYDREGNRRSGGGGGRRGPSNRTRRIITVAVCLLLLVLIICLIVHGVNKANERRESERQAITATTQQQKQPQQETGTAISKVNRFPNLPSTYNMKYAVAVNTAQNIVTVYEKNPADGTYTKAVKVFICSAGLNGATPNGTWYVPDNEGGRPGKMGAWWNLVGNVYGQWCTRIHDGILFHSVPYEIKGDKGSLQEGEYNKLGQNASHGCIRMRVADVKWIYDNIPVGTCVTIYSDATTQEPLKKPNAQKITVPKSDPRHGWDPSDPDPANPWNK